MQTAPSGVLAALTLSVVSAVSIIVCNKYLLSISKFRFATTLTAWHMITTFLWLHVARRLRYFEHKQCPTTVATGFGLLNAVAIGALNLSLAFNSVGLYQMTKLAIIPCTAILQAVFLGVKFSWRVQISLLVLLLGVGQATISDVTFNFLGAVMSLVAILTTSVAQILTSTIQKAQTMSSTQLLYASSLSQALSLSIAGPPLDELLTGQSIFAFSYSTTTVVLILVSCGIAVALNFSNFLVIGKTSPVTFQVLGHLKTCLVLAMGYLVFRDPLSWKNLSGISIALGGMVMYSYFKMQEAKPGVPLPTVAQTKQIV